jgi:hypothetical protein
VFQAVQALLAGLGDVGQTVDELEGIGEASGGLPFEVAVQCAEQFHRLSDGVYAFSEFFEAFVNGHWSGASLPGPIIALPAPVLDERLEL